MAPTLSAGFMSPDDLPSQLSGDMNPAESVGAIMQEKVEEALLDMDPREVTRPEFSRT